ncbi:DNA-binding transcriptional MerR regulator [Amycolatopsis cihanbeyliensis]|uniref:DNA-binding transcriptional MerR regulator n=2 Tax=Amycolatopsis cihanbeyliensis TaxID=1128664 RepID=A0A542DF48_AMYCI|nr:DNA-binding transcriptional MerR regulator [Amycolatopsis cihanbeyliensis]
MRIGEVARRTGLSLRAIRRYAQDGLVRASARGQGDVHLYTGQDLVRLHLVRRMEHLGFDLARMRDVLAVLPPGVPVVGEDDGTWLAELVAAAEGRCGELRAAVAAAEEFAAALRKLADHMRILSASRTTSTTR